MNLRSIQRRTRLSMALSLLCFPATFLIVVSLARTARADVEACVSAHSEGQITRDSGRFVKARETFAQCVADACPAPIRNECAMFLSQLERTMPTVVLGAQDERGNDILGGAVYVDDRPLEGALDGRAIAMDPGPHVFRFEHPDGRMEEVRAVVQEGVKGRLILAQFRAPERGSAPEPVADPPPSRDEPARSNALPLILAGVGAVAFGGFAYFALTGKSQQREFERTCAPNCSREQQQQVASSYLMADIALVTAGVALGSGAYLYFSAAKKSGDEVARGRSLILEAGGRF